MGKLRVKEIKKFSKVIQLTSGRDKTPRCIFLASKTSVPFKPSPVIKLSGWLISL